MPDNMEKENLRVKKTYTALIDAVSALLARRNFKQITARDLCEEALVSRATFYAHFQDKYDLLKHWLAHLGLEAISHNNTYAQIETAANDFFKSNKCVIKNLVDDANNEVLDILSEHILSIFNITVEGKEKGIVSSKDIVLSCFFTGGIINYFLGQAKNKFSSDIKPMNIHLVKIVEKILELTL